MNYINSIPTFVTKHATVIKDSLKTAVLGITNDCQKIYNNDERMASLQDVILKIVGIGAIAFGFYLTYLNVASLALLPNMFSEIGAIHAVITMISIGYTFFSTDAITISENLKKTKTVVLDYMNDSEATNEGKLNEFKNEELGIITGTYLAATKDKIAGIFKKIINYFRFSSTADVSNPRASRSNRLLKLMVMNLIFVTALFYINFQQNALAGQTAGL